MKTDDKNEIGVVVECYNHDSRHCVLVVRSRDAQNYRFFYIPQTPCVNFGDLIQMNYPAEVFYVYRGNSRLTFKINPQVFPNTLLWELINERMNL